jgi:hypothetical protein
MSFIPTKLRLLIITAPLAIAFAAAKLAFHQQGWELWTFNSLTSSLFGAATFIIAFQLSGTLGDFRFGSGLPTVFCQSIESIQDCNLLVGRCRSEYDPQPLQKALVDLTAKTHNTLTTEADLRPLLKDITALTEHYVVLENYPIGSNLNRVQTEQAKLRETVLQIMAIRDADFVGPAYVLLELFTVASSIALLLIQNDNQVESIAVSSLMFVVFLYLVLLIKDLDNPFEYNAFSSLDVDLKVMEETTERLKQTF